MKTGEDIYLTKTKFVDIKKISFTDAIYYGWCLVGVALIAQMVSVGVQNYVFGPFQRPMTEELDWSRSEFVIARTIGMALFAITGIVIGAYVDRHGGKGLMRTGAVIVAISMFLQSFVQELWQWWILNGFILTSGAAMMGNLVVNVTLSKWFVEKRGRAIGFASMGVPAAGIVVTPLAAILIDAVGWREAWRWLALASLFIMIPLSFFMRRAPEDYGLLPDGRNTEGESEDEHSPASIDYANSLTRAQALRNKSFYLIILAFGLGNLSIGMILVNAIPFMEDAGYSKTTAALMITVLSIPSMITKPIWGALSDYFNAQKMSVIGFVFIGIALIVIVFAVRINFDLLTYFGFFLLGMGWGGSIPLQEVIWARFFGRRYLGSVRSAGMPFTFLMMASAPIATAFYFDIVGNYDGAFLFVAAMSFVAVFLILYVKSPVENSVSKL
tara:strand:+ start:939 stop:2264 length:1326 start_codon:yes stop_codon:yes gene_type:complete